MKVPADIEPITAFRKGDEDATRQLHEIYCRSLCYFSEKLIGDKTEAEDISIGTFIKLSHKREGFDT
ncbi:MAG: RNA polymerase sigma factor [Segetibacter sp.]